MPYLSQLDKFSTLNFVLKKKQYIKTHKIKTRIFLLRSDSKSNVTFINKNNGQIIINTNSNLNQF